MICFCSEFLAQFDRSLQDDLTQLASLISTWESQGVQSPQIQWPPPSTPPESLDYWVEFLWQANNIRAVNLCFGIVQALNEASYLCFAILFRAFFEHVLLARHYFLARLLPTVTAAVGRGHIREDELKGMIKDLYDSVSRSRMDWEALFGGDFRGITAKGAAFWDDVSLKNAARDWDKTDAKLGVLTPTGLYAVLCDVAHPNIGSSLACMRADGLGFAKLHGPSIGAKLFRVLFPSLSVVANEFQDIQSKLLLLKFDEGKDPRAHG